jgi:hypothetical protein
LFYLFRKLNQHYEISQSKPTSLPC